MRERAKTIEDDKKKEKVRKSVDNNANKNEK